MGWLTNNKTFALGGFFIIVVLIGIYVWNQNQQNTYYASRQKDCIQLAETKKAELEKDNSIRMMKIGSYIYLKSADDCIFKESTMILSGEDSFMQFGISGLFSGQNIANLPYMPTGRKRSESEITACQNFSSIQVKYFGEGLNCFAGQ